MERRYKSLLLTDDLKLLQEAEKQGVHPVPCLPLRDVTEKEGVGQAASVDLSGYPYVLEDADQVPDRYLDRIDATLCGYPLQILETEHCIVREISKQDIPGLYEIYKEPEITRYMEGLYEDPQKELAYTQEYIKWHYGLYEFGMWIITDHKGRLLGRAGFEQKEDPDYPELGFLIRKDMQGQGLAYEVCKALMDYAAAYIDRAGVRSFCHKDNIPSRRLLQKLGFHQVSRDGGQLCWEITFDSLNGG